MEHFQTKTRLTLHAAMQVVLSEQPGRTATIPFVSEEIERRGLYRQRIGGVAYSGQVRARAAKHPKVFEVQDGDTLRLIE